MKNHAGLKVIVALVILFQASLCVAAPATGSITASQACEAYVSKNKRTNPDNTKLVIDQTYSIFEANKTDNPDWFRVRIAEVNPPERWVSKSCGTVELQNGGGGENGGGGRNACNTPGQEDSYVLALSWQPAFCEGHRAKPECGVDNNKAYQARNFTLHGLWPNKASCGVNYGFCSEVGNKGGNFCSYPPLSLSAETRGDLEQVMPSAAFDNSCLQRHEWYKHGTCQTTWSVDEYYDEAIDLVRQFNEAGVGYFISRNVGNTVTEADFIAKVDCAHGANAHNSIELKCDSGNLVDVYISLPKTITPGAALGDLMRQAQGQFKSNCRGSFKVDPIGFAN